MEQGHASATKLFGQIEGGELVLPDLQREFVWRDSQVRDLASSMYKQFPVGIIVRWETDDPDISTYLLDSEPGQKKGKARFILIDGQQRLSSLVLLRRGKLAPQRGKPRTCKVYFDPLTDSFEVFEAKKVPSTAFHLPVILDPNQKLPTHDELRAKFNITEEQAATALKRLNDVRVLFEKYQFPLHTIPSEVPYSEVSDIFIRINSRGTKVKATELALALLSVQAPKDLKPKVYEFLDDLDDDGWGEVSIPVLIRTMFAIETGRARLRAPSMKDTLKDWDKEKVLKNWKATEKGMTAALKLLESELRLTGTRLVPTQLVLVPIATLLGRSKGKAAPTDSKALALWFLLGSMYSRYTGTTEPRLEEDVGGVFEKKSPAPLFASLKKQRGTLRATADSLTARTDAAILNLFFVEHQHGARDWFSGKPVVDHDFDEHHIFPKKVLRAANVDEDAINDLANLTLITPTANKDIKTKAPSDYLPTLPAGNLVGHFIPPDQSLWELKNYKQFLEARRTLLVEGFNAAYDKMGLDKFDPAPS